jgi:hypothetical protein
VRSLSTTLLLLGLCIGAAPSLRASTCTDTSSKTCFNNGTGGGHTVGFVGDSLTFGSITATAWSTDGSLTFQQAALEQYDTFGLGVCSSSEIPGGCPAPDHAISNQLGASGFFDFVLLRFSQPVTAVSFMLNPFLRDNQEMDYTYFAGNCASTCNPSAFNLLTPLSTVSGFGGNLFSSGGNLTGDCCANSKSTGNLALGSNPGGVNWILIGTSTSPTFDDFFKLESVSYTSTVPEPATFGLAGAALVALGLHRRRKTLSANS